MYNQRNHNRFKRLVKKIKEQGKVDTHNPEPDKRTIYEHFHGEHYFRVLDSDVVTILEWWTDGELTWKAYEDYIVPGEDGLY